MITQIVNENIDQAFYSTARHALHNPSSNLDITLDYKEIPPTHIITGHPEPPKTILIDRAATTTTIPREARDLAKALIADTGRTSQIKAARIHRTWIYIVGIADPITLDKAMHLPNTARCTTSIAYNITADTKDTHFRSWWRPDIAHELAGKIIHPGDIHRAYPDIACVNIDAPSQNARRIIASSLRDWLDGMGLIDH